MGQTAHHYLIFETAGGFCSIAWNKLGITRFQLPTKSAEMTGIAAAHEAGSGTCRARGDFHCYCINTGQASQGVAHQLNADSEVRGC